MRCALCGTTLQTVVDNLKASVRAMPGAELVLPGIEDLAAGRITIGSCLVSIAAPVLARSGLTAGLPTNRFVIEAERELYRLLQGECANPYGRYNSLLRRLVSFERAVRAAIARR